MSQKRTPESRLPEGGETAPALDQVLALIGQLPPERQPEHLRRVAAAMMAARPDALQKLLARALDRLKSAAGSQNPQTTE